MPPAWSRPRPRACALAVLVALGAGLAVTGPAARAAGAQTAPTSPTTAPFPATESPQQALAESVQLTIDYTQVTAQLSQLDQSITLVQARLADAESAFQQTTSDMGTIQNDLNLALQGIRGRAVATYERASDLISATLEIRHAGSLSAGEQYAEAADAAGEDEITHLDAELNLAQTDRADKAAAVRDLQSQLVLLNTEHDKLEAQAASDQIAVQGLGGVPVMGQPVLSAAQMAGWFHSTGAHAVLAGGMTIDALTEIYIQEGDAADVRGDVAFAQSIIETGSFEHASDNNYAGIGACDSCVGEPGFPTPRDGVRAQMQLLRSYADPDSTALNIGFPPDPTLFGADPLAAAANYDSFYLKGKVPLWNEMGGGNWATDPNYATKVLHVYEEMLTYASANP